MVIKRYFGSSLHHISRFQLLPSATRNHQPLQSILHPTFMNATSLWLLPAHAGILANAGPAADSLHFEIR